jgi:UDP-glucose 4-epimerase
MTSPSERAPILVVGGRGFVGAAAVRTLCASGETVHVFGPPSPVPLPVGARETIGSIEDVAAMRDVLARLRPRVVVSFAAFSAGPIGLGRSGEADPERMLAVNVLGFRRLLEACVAAGIERVVWTSSTVVFGRAESLDLRLAEDAPRRPLTNYGLSKVLAEDVASYMRGRHGIETVGLRIPLMLGPGLWYDGAASVLKTLVAEARPGSRPDVAVPAIAFDAMHVDDGGDLVAALCRIATPLAPIYNVAGFTTCYRDIAATLSEMVPGYAPHLCADVPPIVYPLVTQDSLEQDTGWRHRRDLRAVLADMLCERRSSAP